MKAFIRHFKKTRPSTYIMMVLLTSIAIVSILPIIFIISNAFKPLSELFMYPPRFFARYPTMQNFTDFIFATSTSTVPFSRYFFNSLMVTVSSLTLTLLISAACSYAFSKMTFPGKNALFNLIIVSLMFAPEAVVITRYLIISKIGIVNTYMGHILPQIALPVGVFLMKQFMDQIPMSLSESAHIDGASELQILWFIVLPTVLPAVGAVMIISFQSVWGDVSTSTLYMIDESMKTLPYFINTLTSGLTSSIARQGAMAAAGLLLFLPNFFIFALLQKSMIETMVTSGIK